MPEPRAAVRRPRAGRPRLTFAAAERFVDSVRAEDVARYADYWRSVAPRDDHAHWLRWVFGYMSIHTTWERNVIGYRAVARLGRRFTRADLEAAVHVSGVGLTRNRTVGLWRLRHAYRRDPGAWQPAPFPAVHRAQRDRMVAAAFGIGLAKVSFVMELASPERCGVACLDTHLLQLYGLPGSRGVSAEEYRRAEAHWVGLCDARGLSSPLVRHLYWDRKQGRPDTRYWSHVFEEES